MKPLNWSEVAPHPSNILIAGDVGTGKTALAGTFVEYGQKEKLKCYSVGRQFPKCRKVNESFKPPKDSVMLVDDAHLTSLYAHTPGSKITRIYDIMQRQKRHRGHSIVYTTQDTTGFTLRLIRLIDAVCLFQPNMMAIDYERPKIRVLYHKAIKALPKDQYGHVWIKSQNRETHEVTEDVYSFSLPKFWGDDVSIPKEGKTPQILNPILNTVRSIGRLFG